MFARIFHVQLRPGQGDAYTRTVEQKVVPVLQRSQGFHDEMTMISADGKEAVGITFWEREEDVKAYEKASYAEVRKALAPFMTGTPKIDECYKVTTATFAQLTVAH